MNEQKSNQNTNTKAYNMKRKLNQILRNSMFSPPPNNENKTPSPTKQQRREPDAYHERIQKITISKETEKAIQQRHKKIEEEKKIETEDDEIIILTERTRRLTF